MAMSNILAIDTTLGGCSVALSGGILREETARNRQTSQLAAMTQAVMQEAQLSFDALDAYAITTGPGSFTGVRIGLAFIRGLALAVAKPVYAISTLELLAYQAIDQGIEGDILSTINAHRGQIYAQAFTQQHGLPHAMDEAQAHAIEDIPQQHPQATRVGDCHSVMEAVTPLLPHALHLAHYAARLPLPTTRTKPEPVYLRAPDAKAQNGDLTL